MTISNMLRILSLGTIVLGTNIWCMENLKQEYPGTKWWYRARNELIRRQQEEARRKKSTHSTSLEQHAHPAQAK